MLDWMALVKAVLTLAAIVGVFFGYIAALAYYPLTTLTIIGISGAAILLVFMYKAFKK